MLQYGGSGMIAAVALLMAGQVTGQSEPVKIPNTAKRPATAPLVETVSLELLVEGPGEVGWGKFRCAPSGSEASTRCMVQVPKGRALTLTAKPFVRAMFESWDGACEGRTARCTLTPTSSINISANFISLPSRRPGSDGMGAN